jgi:site-specific recombinase XerD
VIEKLSSVGIFCLPEDLTPDNLKDYFAALVESHSWSTVKIDRLGLQFYWRHVLKKDWRWVDIVKPPKVKTIPDILTPSEIERLLAATRKLRYRVFLLTTYSMGLRLEEALCLQVGDIAYMDVGKRREQDAEALTQSARRYTFVVAKGTRIECCRCLILP